MIMDMAAKSGMSILELGRHYAVARGHMTMIGTPQRLPIGSRIGFEAGLATDSTLWPLCFRVVSNSL